LHGGGYVLGSLYTHQNLISGFSYEARCRVFGIDYRLAPEHAFPRAIEDAVAGYQHLLARGVDPSKIVIAGESAGGGLTLATLLKLRELELPYPAAVALISPWCDLEGLGKSMSLHADADYVTKPHLLLCARWLLGDDHDAKHPLASPIYADYTGLPPLYIHAGGSEALLDDALRVAQRAREAGVEVDLDVYPDMVHAFHIFASFLPEARVAIRRIGEYVRRKTGAVSSDAGAERSKASVEQA
jgi:acetyl esterase/lipase